MTRHPFLIRAVVGSRASADLSRNEFGAFAIIKSQAKLGSWIYPCIWVAGAVSAFLYNTLAVPGVGEIVITTFAIIIFCFALILICLVTLGAWLMHNSISSAWIRNTDENETIIERERLRAEFEKKAREKIEETERRRSAG